jgi:hypothetical protein
MEDIVGFLCCETAFSSDSNKRLSNKKQLNPLKIRINNKLNDVQK